MIILWVFTYIFFLSLNKILHGDVLSPNKMLDGDILSPNKIYQGDIQSPNRGRQNSKLRFFRFNPKRLYVNIYEL